MHNLTLAWSSCTCQNPELASRTENNLALGTISSMEVVVDDIIIWGTTQEGHDTTLEKVLQRATERNLKKLYKDKSQITLKQISYIGHVLGEDGIKPDPQKVRAISEMERPNSKEELQQWRRT